MTIVDQTSQDSAAQHRLDREKAEEQRPPPAASREPGAARTLRSRLQTTTIWRTLRHLVAAGADHNGITS